MKAGFGVGEMGVWTGKRMAGMGVWIEYDEIVVSKYNIPCSCIDMVKGLTRTLKYQAGNHAQ